MHRTRCTALILCAIALLLAGCSGDGDSGGSSSPVPRGLGGPSGKSHNGHHHKHNGGKNKPGKHHHKRNRPTSSSSASGNPTRSTSPQVSTPTRTQTTSSAPGGGGQTQTSSSAPHPTLPTVVVTPHTGLAGVQTVTVEGFHFKPNTLLAVAECHDRGQDTGLPDCNINNVLTYAPGVKVRSDANGHVGPLQITVRKTFKSVNCGAVKCLVAISEPALRPDPADEGDQYLKFQ